MIKQTFKILLFILQLISGLIALALLLSILSCYISPARYWFLPFFGLAFQIIFIVNLIALVFWAVIKNKFVFVHIAIVVVALFYVPRFFQLFGESTEDKDAIKIISYNTYGFKERDSICEFIMAEDADIACFQEMYMGTDIKSAEGNFKKMLQKYKYSCSDKASGQFIVSKYPIIHEDNYAFKDRRSTKIVDLNIKGNKVRIYNCHLASMYIFPEDIKKVVDNDKRNITNTAKQTTKTMRGRYKERAGQADTLSMNICKSPYPVIVCGDFNDTPMSYAYQTIRGKLKDAFIEAGSGIVKTFSFDAYSPIRIDYILGSKQIKFCEYKALSKITFSDHYPVVVKFKIK